MSNEEIREEEEEEVIEVVSEDSESDTPVSSGVDIIGDRPVRRSSQQAPPGCLYSFLLFLIGFGVGWMGCYAYDQMQTTEEEGDTLMARITQATGAIKEATTADVQQAAEYAANKNYGLASDTLTRAAQYFTIAGNLSGKLDPMSTALSAVADMLRSNDPATQQEGVEKLAEFVTDEDLKAKLVPPAVEEEAVTESEGAAAPAESEAAVEATESAVEEAPAEEAPGDPAPAAEPGAAPAEDAPEADTAEPAADAPA